MVVISEARGSCGLPSLGACEWAPPATPVISGWQKRKKEGIITKHRTWLLFLPWEYTYLAAATAKRSGWCPDTWSLSLPKTLQLGATGAAPPAWAKWDRVFFAWSAGSRGKPRQSSLIPEMGVAHCHWSYLNKNHLQSHSPKGHQRGGHCDQTPPVGALAPPGTHPPCCCHCQTFWAVPTHLISVTSQDPATRSTLYNTSYVG